MSEEASAFPLARDVTVIKNKRCPSPHAHPEFAARRRYAHLCAHEWDSWIRWRCAVGGTPEGALDVETTLSLQHLIARFESFASGSVARRGAQRFARSDRETRKFGAS